MLIPACLLAAVSLLSMLTMVWKKQYEHAFTRLLLGVFYAFLSLSPETEIETARTMSRWFMFLLFGVEIVSYTVMKLTRRKMKLEDL